MSAKNYNRLVHAKKGNNLNWAALYLENLRNRASTTLATKGGSTIIHVHLRALAQATPEDEEATGRKEKEKGFASGKNHFEPELVATSKTPSTTYVKLRKEQIGQKRPPPLTFATLAKAEPEEEEMQGLKIYSKKKRVTGIIVEAKNLNQGARSSKQTETVKAPKKKGKGNKQNQKPANKEKRKWP
ncbi:hypothetical protein GOP47_0008098 [Adiantum capillus-veneris]|uniref:Uncharacterized protein n=1 Tax=Adiantum capillus-veneris TaxID=13818 RepID=A0A9D4UXX2_ADICA|nr:hypothetical protein GOP47_0008098 [Adiantum capillus-veneris]